MNNSFEPAAKSRTRRRAPHAAMDRAVLDAYGWLAIPTPG
jgi:hypothetical protein